MNRAPDDADVDDRRDAPRVEVGGLYSLRLDPRDGRAPISCALLDHSVTGIRVESPGDVVIPDDVGVLIGEIAHNARVVWRKGAVLGIDFIDEHHSIY